ncbi:MAG: hypothetical protein ABFQ95_01175 [Pseudomonadota bacterium]
MDNLDLQYLYFLADKADKCIDKADKNSFSKSCLELLKKHICFIGMQKNGVQISPTNYN